MQHPCLVALLIPTTTYQVPIRYLGPRAEWPLAAPIALPGRSLPVVQRQVGLDTLQCRLAYVTPNQCARH